MQTKLSPKQMLSPPPATHAPPASVDKAAPAPARLGPSGGFSFCSEPPSPRSARRPPPTSAQLRPPGQADLLGNPLRDDSLSPPLVTSSRSSSLLVHSSQPVPSPAHHLIHSFTSAFTESLPRQERGFLSASFVTQSHAFTVAPRGCRHPSD